MGEDENNDAYLERLVDTESLRSYLEMQLGDTDTFQIERHQVGHSNETLFLTWGEESYVIRRPPPGETAEKAHDVLREYEVVSALQDAAVPVPRTVLACDDESIIGSEFYVTERLSGDVLRDEEPNRFATPSNRRRIGQELVDVLATIHDVDYVTAGLRELGHPEGFTERQVERWVTQLEWAFEVTANERSVPKLQEIGEWLTANVPSEYDSALVHGDYKVDNVMYAPSTSPEISGVFDWELSTLGDPLTDLGWMLAFWRNPGDPKPAVPELQSQFMERSGYLTRAELVERYEARTERPLENDRFYRTLAVFKLAGLGEMFFRRHLEGNSDDPLYPVMETRVPQLADRAERIIDGQEPL